MSVPLRDYQAETVERARDAIRAGAKNVLICAPTGAGKTQIASHLIHEAKGKGRRANFVVDRLSLLNQTSEVFDGHGIDHGVVQSQHQRFSPSKPVQVCSIQTVTRRSWPESALDVIDEAHVLHESVKKRIKGRDRITLGLTATPFTKGLGKHFDAIINVTTTNKLIEQGWLSPYRIFSCAEPNMEGVKVTKLGEWDSGESEKRALEVVGDVVAEYLRHGEGRKFICSAVDTTHVEELQRQFLAAGINAASYTYKDDDEDRAETVTEFRKSDSAIRGLITVTAASRGFDVPSVSCIIMARPLRKSLAEHIQLFGRGLRICEGKTNCLVLDHCIVSGQRVLTHRGLVSIEAILLTDRIWDGHEFVAHKGVVSRGIRQVITYAGLTATADHPVKTKAGWRTLGQCADEQARIVTTGVGRSALWERHGHFTGPAMAWSAGEAIRACTLRVRHLWLSLSDLVDQLAGWAHQGLSRLQSAGALPQVAVCASGGNEAAMPEPEGSAVQGLRRARDRVPFRLSDHLRSMDQGELDAAFGPGEFRVGPNRQRRALCAWQSALGDSADQLEQHQGQQVGSVDAQVQTGTPGRSLRRRIAARLSRAWDVVCGHRGAVGCAVTEAQGEVWDILDCGPRNSFTCEGLLVHNSGNMARFWQDMNEFFEVGVTQLDDGKKKDKPKPKEKAEAEPVKCPQCRAMHKPMPFCPACGHEYPKKRAIEHVPGTLKELIATGNQIMLRARLWPQIVGYVLERREGEQAQRMAQAIYKNMTGEFARARVETTTPAPCSYEVRQKIRAGQIRRSYAQRKDSPPMGVSLNG